MSSSTCSLCRCSIADHPVPLASLDLSRNDLNHVIPSSHVGDHDYHIVLQSDAFTHCCSDCVPALSRLGSALREVEAAREECAARSGMGGIRGENKHTN